MPGVQGKERGEDRDTPVLLLELLHRIHRKGDRLTVYEIEEDGTLTSLNDLLFEEGEEVEAEAM